MLSIPPRVLTVFLATLKERGVEPALHTSYRKWLRYYLDYCSKYHLQTTSPDSPTRFLDKLGQKNQAEWKVRQAAHAVSLYLDKAVVGSGEGKSGKQGIKRPPAEPAGLRDAVGESFGKWAKAHADLVAVIRTKHYSPKTLKSYVHWARKMQDFAGDREPSSLTSEDVKGFLTHLAVECFVSASSQNQAFNALLFFFRHVLEKEFGEIRDVVRAKRRPYIPVVLSRQEVDSVIRQLQPPYDLVAKLLYGCGLRLFECLKLRVHDFNFDAGLLTVHDGKGKKDRSVPLPRLILPELLAQLERVKKLHEHDLRAGYAGVFLDNLLEKKYKNAPRELVWQWFFPAKTLTTIEGTMERRRYHLHERHVQKAIKSAAGRARLTKRVSSHTFRHSFATHLLQANYDIRTIQELLGHSDVKTTMIYTHTVPSRTVKEARSPLDFPPAEIDQRI
ncbi:MAG: integron integrase [Desulfobacteraceae bacterium]|nr:MAG: integron integrase [Desulfobacteraceae bacterium]